MDKLYGYIRVSTDKQVEAGTYKNQERAIADFLKGRDVKLVKTFTDKGISGSTVDRPAFQEMLARLGEVDGVVVYDTDRLARDFDLGIDLMQQFKAHGKKLYIAKTGNVIDFNVQREEQLIHVIKSWVAEQERLAIRARQRQGIDRARREGRRLGRPGVKVNWNKYDYYLKEIGLPKTKIARMPDISNRGPIDIRTLYKKMKDREV
jgi:site-specific DNA recombinase